MARRQDLDGVTYRLVIGAAAALALVVLVGPVLVVLMTSFDTERALQFPPKGFSLQWYQALLDPARSALLHHAALNSLAVAGAAAAIATVLGTAAAIALQRSRSTWARALDTLFMSPMVLPTLAFGLAALMFFSLVGLEASMPLLVVGHAVIIGPYVLRTTIASLSQLDPSILECSASLGASRFYGFRRITLPLILPGIAAGAFLAFMASFDNVSVSLFLTDPRTDMLPLRLFGMMETSLDVRVAAVSGVLVVVTFLLMVAMERLTGVSRRLQG
jgi:putative spermidine/putrescine transport system permease protein